MQNIEVADVVENSHVPVIHMKSKRTFTQANKHTSTHLRKYEWEWMNDVFIKHSRYYISR